MRTNLRPERARDRAAERRLADARRPDEAENRAVEPLDERQHADVVEHALLHVLETVVVLVEHLRARARRRARRRCARSTAARRSSRGRCAPRPTRATSTTACRSRRSSRRARASTGSGSPFASSVRRQLVDVVAVLTAQLAMDRLELLLQVELALVLEQRATHVVVDLPLEAEQLDLARSARPPSASQQGGKLVDRRAAPGAGRAACRGAPRSPNACRAGESALWISVDQLGGQPPVERHVLLEQRQRAPQQHLVVVDRAPAPASARRLRAQAVAARDVARHPRAGDALRRARAPCPCPSRDSCRTPRDDADAIEVRRRRLLGLRVALRDEQHQPVLLVRRLERRQRRRRAPRAGASRCRGTATTSRSGRTGRRSAVTSGAPSVGKEGIAEDNSRRPVGPSTEDRCTGYRRHSEDRTAKGTAEAQSGVPFRVLRTRSARSRRTNGSDRSAPVLRFLLPLRRRQLQQRRRPVQHRALGDLRPPPRPRGSAGRTSRP